MANTFGKNEKLKSKKAISELFSEGKHISAYPLRLVYKKTDAPLKVAVSVSKRLFKTAVARNRIKRLLREAYRLNKPQLLNNEITGFSLMILYISPEMPDFELINTKTKKVLSKFIKTYNP